jgi:hypothetical protein
MAYLCLDPESDPVERVVAKGVIVNEDVRAGLAPFQIVQKALRDQVSSQMKYGLRLVIFSETWGRQHGVKMRNHWAVVVA